MCFTDHNIVFKGKYRQTGKKKPTRPFVTPNMFIPQKEEYKYKKDKAKMF